jgi:hypothetical protein
MNTTIQPELLPKTESDWINALTDESLPLARRGGGCIRPRARLLQLEKLRGAKMDITGQINFVRLQVPALQSRNIG